MGGKWDEQGGREYNFNAEGVESVIQATRFVVNELQVEKAFLGFEIGYDVFTGSKLTENDVLGKAVKEFLCKSLNKKRKLGLTAPENYTTRGRESWDPMLIMAAFYDKYEGAFAYEKGKASVGESGENYFEKDANGIDRYALKIHNNAYYEQIIDEIIKE